jgi:response regulator RpfG family c-di-GMP phosphodiesterase
MNDAAAIASLSFLFAAANDIGVDYKRSLKDLVCASLVMDFPLIKFGKLAIEQYYLDRNELPREIFDQIRQHPVEAYKMAQKKLPNFSSATFELILTHHELNSGAGYPKKLRTGTQPLLNQVFSLAVDVFEHLKEAQLKEEPTTVTDLVNHLNDPMMDVNFKRHPHRVINKVIEFLA